MSRVELRSLLTSLENEETDQKQFEGTEVVSQEDVVLGAIAGLIPVISTIYGVAVGAEVEDKAEELEKKEKELAKLKADYAKALNQAVSKAEKSGKLSKVSQEGAAGAILGGIVGSIPGLSVISNAFLGHMADDYERKIEKKEQEIAAINKEIKDILSKSKPISKISSESTIEPTSAEVLDDVEELSVVGGAASGDEEVVPSAEGEGDETLPYEPGESNEVSEVVQTADPLTNKVSEELTDLQTTADSLESLLTSLEAAVQDGGLSPQSAEFFNVALEAHAKRLGIKQQVTLSVETFERNASRIQATQISLETTKTILEHVKEAIRKAT